MAAPTPSISANPRTSLELQDSCNCASTCCWGNKKEKRRSKPSTVEKRVDEVAAKVVNK